MSAAQPQRGWIGIVGLLIALVIVALLAQTLLKTYGLLPGSDAAVEAGPRSVGAVGPAPTDATVASPAARARRGAATAARRAGSRATD